MTLYFSPFALLSVLKHFPYTLLLLVVRKQHII